MSATRAVPAPAGRRAEASRRPLPVAGPDQKPAHDQHGEVDGRYVAIGIFRHPGGIGGSLVG